MNLFVFVSKSVFLSKCNVGLELNIPARMLPVIKSSSSFFGAVNGAVWLQAPSTSFDTQQLDRYTGCSITGVLGDQQAALFVSFILSLFITIIITSYCGTYSIVSTIWYLIGV